jgi:hypothetical protein
MFIIEMNIYGAWKVLNAKLDFDKKNYQPLDLYRIFITILLFLIKHITLNLHSNEELSAFGLV